MPAFLCQAISQFALLRSCSLYHFLRNRGTLLLPYLLSFLWSRTFNVSHSAHAFEFKSPQIRLRPYCSFECPSSKIIDIHRNYRDVSFPQKGRLPGQTNRLGPMMQPFCRDAFAAKKETFSICYDLQTVGQCHALTLY